MLLQLAHPVVPTPTRGPQFRPFLNLAAVGGAQNDIVILQFGKQGNCIHRRHRKGIIGAVCRRPMALEQMFEGDPQRMAQKRHHHMRLDARLQLMKQRTESTTRFSVPGMRPRLQSTAFTWPTTVPLSPLADCCAADRHPRALASSGGLL